MTGAMIAQLVLQFGPSAIDLIQKLVAVWNKELTVEEVNQVLLTVPRKTYADYINEAIPPVGPMAPK